MPEKPKNWNASQWKFIEWLALPKSERKPKTQALIAKDIGVHETTLSDWKKIAGFMDAVTAITREQLKDNLNDIYAALVKRAVDGDVQAIKLALEITREYVPRQEMTGANGGAITWEQIFSAGAGDDTNNSDVWGS